MNNKYNIYLLSESYYDYLKEQKLYEIELKNERPYIGFIKIKISKYNYLIPLTSKSNKYSIHHKYSIPTYNNKAIPVLNNKTL